MSFMDRVVGGGAQRPQDSAGKEVQSLHGKILQVENQITKYKSMVNKLGTAVDTTEFREKINVVKNNIQAQSRTLKEKIVAFNSTADKLEPNQQARLKKAVSSFMTVLDDFQETIKLCAEREIATPPNSYSEGVQLPQKTSELETESLLRHQQRQQALQLENDVAYNESIIEERDQEIGGLVRDIAELNEMFQDVAVLVHDQGMMVDDIESNITQAADRVQSGRQELVKAERNQKKATNKKLWILLCFIIIISIIVTVIILST